MNRVVVFQHAIILMSFSLGVILVASSHASQIAMWVIVISLLFGSRVPSAMYHWREIGVSKRSYFETLGDRLSVVLALITIIISWRFW